MKRVLNLSIPASRIPAEPVKLKSKKVLLLAKILNSLGTTFIVMCFIIIGACEDDYITTELDSPQVEEPILPEHEQNHINENLTMKRATALAVSQENPSKVE